MLMKIRDFFKERVNGFYGGAIIGAAWLYLIGMAVFYALMSVLLPTLNGDNIEHIHSSFLVATGEVPYRDFFQHHNPLLWYMFAPVAKLFSYNATIAEAACFVSLLVFLKSLVYVYRICSEFLSDKFWGLIAAAAVGAPGGKLFAVDFRPDNYMVFCLMGGIYYYFSYLKEKKPAFLNVAFLWFFVGFMFAQKALFPLFFLGLTGLYFWYKKEIITADLIKALILPLVGCVAFLLYLYYYDMVELYFKSNYTFNLNLANGFEMTKIAEFPTYMVVLMCVGWAGALSALFSRNKYWLVCAFLFVGEFVQRRFYFSPYSYYYWLLVYLGVLCGVPLLWKLNGKNRVVSLGVLGGLFYVFVTIGGAYYDFYQDRQDKPYLPDYITRRITPCDYVFNGDGMMYNIFGKDPAYYWQLIGQLDVIGEQTGIKPKPDINQLIRDLKPKFVFGLNYFNKFSSESGRKEIVHYIDMDLIKTYYEVTPFTPVYELKKEYDHRRCVKDRISGKWQYQD